MFSDIKVDARRCTLTSVDGGLFIAVNSLISVIGSSGNIFVCLTVLFTPSLQVVSNYCIVNLALADLIVNLLTEPLAVAIFVGKLDGTCYVRAEHAARFIGNLSCAVSILTLATMSFDRCFVILKPMRYKQVVTPTLLKSILTFYWLFAFIVPILDAFVEDKLVYIYFILCGIIVLYSVVIICYSAIFIVVQKQNSVRQRELQNHQAVNKEKDKRLAKTIALVIGFFTVFWMPFGYHIATSPQKNYGVSYIAPVTASFANSAINPLIYFYRNKCFRDALRRILMSCHRRQIVTPLRTWLQNPSNSNTTPLFLQSRIHSKKEDDTAMKMANTGASY